jgi:hypothetical protein
MIYRRNDAVVGYRAGLTTVRTSTQYLGGSVINSARDTGLATAILSGRGTAGVAGSKIRDSGASRSHTHAQSEETDDDQPKEDKRSLTCRPYHDPSLKNEHI